MKVEYTIEDKDLLSDGVSITSKRYTLGVLNIPLNFLISIFTWGSVFFQIDDTSRTSLLASTVDSHLISIRSLRPYRHSALALHLPLSHLVAPSSRGAL